MQLISCLCMCVCVCVCVCVDMMLAAGSQKLSSTDRSSSSSGGGGVEASSAAVSSTARPGVMADYCEREYFDADCSTSSASSSTAAAAAASPHGGERVIVMRSAVFGRMKDSSRCVRPEYGSIGCRADVLPTVDLLCSGRRRCRFHVSTLHSARPCPTELVSYLEASFDCVTGLSASRTNRSYLLQLLCPAQSSLARRIKGSGLP